MDASLKSLTATINKYGQAFEAFRTTNDERIEALEQGDDSKAAELGAKLAKIEKDVGAASKLKRDIEVEMALHKERIEELESRSRQPGRTPSTKRADEYKSLWLEWMRNKGQSPLHEQQLQDLQKKMWEAKDVTIGAPAGGGFAVPEDIRREIERLEKKFSPVRDLVNVVQVGTSDYKALVNIRGTTSGWVGEAGPRPATLTSQLREVAPTHGELYAYPQASEWSLDDIFFNVEAWIAEEVAQEFAIQEGDAVIRGSGVSKPTGMLNSAPTAVADFASPARAAAVYEFVASTASPDAILPDALIDLVYRLNSAYRANAAWAFNSVVAGAIRKLKDTTGQYLWQPGLQAGQPDRLLGYTASIWEQMDNVGTNTHPVAFGDFRRGYILTDRIGLRITRDNVTNVGFVRFYIRRREGGHVLDNNAIKFLKTI